MRIYLVSLFCFLIGFQALSQLNNAKNLLPNVFPVNPKAFELMKFTDVPVSKYTGLPVISIPIFSMDLNGSNIPISLNYHSNGFRVTEEAGWTGLGWQLDVGGSITQVVNGFDDFGWYKSRNNEADAMVAVASQSSAMPASILNTCTNVNFTVQTGEVQLPPPPNSGILNFEPDPYLMEGFKDVEPDIFKFSFNNYSGEFVLDWKTGEFFCLNDKNIKIDAGSYSANSTNSIGPPVTFHIILPDGGRYYFALKEETSLTGIQRETSLPYTQLEHIIGQKSNRVYHLTKMILPNGEMVDFTYVNTPVIENLPSLSESKDIYTYKQLPNYCGSGTPTPIEQRLKNVNPTRVINYSRQTLSYVSEIKFSKGRIEFLSDNNRLDLIGSRKLNFIKIYNNSSVLVNEFEFTYDYFISENIGMGFDNYLNTFYYNTGKQETEITHRLKLLSVKERGTPAYTFQYDDLKLPKKTSYAADYWGFYNGKTDNSSFFPNIYRHGLYEYKDEIIPISSSVSGINNNRSSNLASTRASVLNKVSYPTGGNATYTYELNEFDNFSVPDDEHSVLSTVFLNDRNLSSDILAQAFSSDVTSFLYDGELNINTYGPLSHTTNANSAYIRLTILKKTPANYTLVYNTVSFWPTYFTTPYGQLGNTISDVISDSRILQFNLKPNNMGYETFKLNQGYFIRLDPDKIYIIQVNLDNSFGPQDSYGEGGNASVRFKFLKNSSKTLSYGGGLRLKEVKLEESYNKPIIKRYTYENGKLMSPLIFMIKNSFNYEFGEVDTREEARLSDGKSPVLYGLYEVTKTNLSSSSFYTPSNNASGKFIGYSKVTETNLSYVNGGFIENENGKTVEMFTNEPDIGIIDPTMIPDNLNPNNLNPLNFLYPSRRGPIKNGQTLERKIYDKYNSLLESKVFQYTPIYSKCVYGRVAAFSGQYVVGLCTAPPMPRHYSTYSIGFYPITNNKNVLTRCSTFSYSGANVNLIVEKYSYDSRDQLKIYERSDSKNGFMKTTNYYPYDFPEYTFTMVWDNFIDVVIESTIEQGATGYAKNRHFFNQSGGNTTPRVYLKSKTQSAFGNSPLEDDVLFEKYGEVETKHENKILQYRGRDGVITSVLWGYGGQYPVAKILNATYDVAKSYISQSFLDNPPNDVDLRSHLNALRGIPNCFVTTYTYNPLIGVTSETDPSDKTIFYEYDSFNRLMHNKDQYGNILKKYCYNYVGQLVTCPEVPLFQNAAYSQSFTRNNCTNGGVGSSVIFSVAAGQFTSPISLEDANQQAVNYVNANGLMYANANGNCTYYNSIQTASFLRTNCDLGLTGSYVSYTIPAGAYSSTISLEDANQKAINALYQNGPGYANANGTCTPASGCNLDDCGYVDPNSKKCINGQCYVGLKIYYGNNPLNFYECMYKYEWWDGTSSIIYYEPSYGTQCLSNE